VFSQLLEPDLDHLPRIVATSIVVEPNALNKLH